MGNSLIPDKLNFILKHTTGDNIGDQVLNADGPGFMQAPPAGSTPDIKPVNDAFATLKTYKTKTEDYKISAEPGTGATLGHPGKFRA